MANLLYYPLLNPRQIPDVLHWFPLHDPDYMTISSGLVSSLTDPVANTTFSSSGSSRPTYNATLDGNKGGTTFNGTNYLQSNETASYWNNLITSTPKWIFIRASPNSVTKTNGTSAAQRGFFFSTSNRVSGAGDTRSIGVRYESQNKLSAYLTQGASGTRYTRSTTTFTGSSWQTAVVYSDPSNGTAANRVLFEVNGTALTTNYNSSTYSGAYNNNAQYPLTIGMNYNLITSGYESGLDGSIREIVIADNTISADNKQRIYDWINRS